MQSAIATRLMHRAGCALCLLTLAAGCARSAPVTSPRSALAEPAPVQAAGAGSAPVAQGTPSATASSTALPTAPLAAVPAAASPIQPAVAQLRDDVLAATRLQGVRRGVWGMAVHSLDRNERVFDLNPAALLVPASAAKIVSAASAADAVGWNYQFVTELRAAGSIVSADQAARDTALAAGRSGDGRFNGVLKGDLIVVGSGDPSIGGRAGDDVSVFVDAVKASSIRRIEGRIIGDDDRLEEPRPQLAWAWDDLGYTSGAIFGALNLGENRMTVTVAPGAAPGLPASVLVEPRAASRPLTNRAVTGAPGSTPLLWPEQRPGETVLTIAGSLPVGAAPVRMSVSVGNPTFWFAAILRQALQQAGIEITGEAFDVDDVSPRPDTAAAPVLFTYRSHALAEIVQPMLKDSINLYAEAALRLNAAAGALPTNDAALEGLRKRLDAWGIAADGQQLIDGSGLSRRNVVAAETLLAVLRRMHDAGGTSPFMTGLPVAGVDGSLAARMRGTAAEGNVRAKTGSMSNVRSLAGYVTSRDGERFAFVVMVNNFEGSGADAQRAIDTIAVRLASFSRSGAVPLPASRPDSR